MKIAPSLMTSILFAMVLSGRPVHAGGASSALILDNGAPGTSAQGQWKAMTRNSPYGQDALYARYSGSYTFKPKLNPGPYNVYMWWTASDYRSLHVPVVIRTTTGDSVVQVNQRANGGQWNLLGTFDLDASAFVQIQVATRYAVCADAVEFEPVQMVIEPPADLTPPPTMTDVPPAQPQGLAAAASTGLVSLNWNDNTEADLASYSVYRSASSGGSYQVIASGLNVSNYSDSSVTSGMSYYYVVTAVDRAGNESPQSLEVTGTPPLPPPPPPPAPSPSPVASDSAASLTWNRPSINADGTALTDLAGFKIYMGTAPSSYSSVTNVGNVTTYNFSPLTPATYYFVVTAYDSIGNESGPSNESAKLVALAGTPVPPPAPPPPPPAQIISDPTASLTWDPPAINADGTALTDLAGFKIYIGTAPGSYSSVMNVGNVMAYTFSALTPATYYFVVTAYDSAGNESGASSESSKTTS